jgi:hypothetical protein
MSMYDDQETYMDGLIQFIKNVHANPWFLRRDLNKSNRR